MKQKIPSATIAILLIQFLTFTAFGHVLLGEKVDEGHIFDCLVVFVGYEYNKKSESGFTIPYWSTEPNLEDFQRRFLFQVIAPRPYEGSLFMAHHDGELAAGNPYKLFKTDTVYRISSRNISIHNFQHTYCAYKKEVEVNHIKETYDVELISLDHDKKELEEELLIRLRNFSNMTNNLDKFTSVKINSQSNYVESARAQIEDVNQLIQKYEKHPTSGSTLR